MKYISLLLGTLIFLSFPGMGHARGISSPGTQPDADGFQHAVIFRAFDSLGGGKWVFIDTGKVIEGTPIRRVVYPVNSEVWKLLKKLPDTPSRCRVRIDPGEVGSEIPVSAIRDCEPWSAGDPI